MSVTPFRRKPPVSPPPSEVDYDSLAASIPAGAIEAALAAEQQIKEELLRCLRAGEHEKAARILESWIANPVAVEVAAGMER